MILRLLGVNGIVGIVVSSILGLLLLIQTGETRHWKKQSARFEQLLSDETAAHVRDLGRVEQAAKDARESDKANLARVQAEQAHLNQESNDETEKRLADARARYERLRQQARQAAAGSGVRAGASMSGLPAAGPGADEAAGQDRLPPADALTATEQAIQLDELIKWVKQVARIPTSGDAGAAAPATR